MNQTHNLSRILVTFGFYYGMRNVCCFTLDPPQPCKNNLEDKRYECPPMADKKMQDEMPPKALGSMQFRGLQSRHLIPAPPVRSTSHDSANVKYHCVFCCIHCLKYTRNSEYIHRRSDKYVSRIVQYA